MSKKPKTAARTALMVGFGSIFTLYGGQLKDTPSDDLSAETEALTDATLMPEAADDPEAEPLIVDTPEREAKPQPTSLSLVPLPAPEEIDMETLWLARCIFSETKRPEEQELVAWVIRNRVETGFRGKRSYESVVLDPYQFSAFNLNNEKRDFYTTLGPYTTKIPGWRRALQVAHHVRHAYPRFRPFPLKTRHFYSERSMSKANPHPKWADGRQPVRPDRAFEVEVTRFRFFAGIS